nr:hypothetical protein [uncultured Brevundimonas sp.]
MRKFEAISRFIKREWGDDPVADACLSIIKWVIGQPNQNSEMIMLGTLGKVSGIDTRDPELMRVISVLTSSTDVLSWRFAYIPDDDEPTYLNDEEAAEFVASSSFVDRNSGNLVDNAPSLIYPYFSANPDDLRAEQK